MSTAHHFPHRSFVFLSFLLIFSTSAFADTSAQDPIDQAYANMKRVAVAGPSAVKLGNKAMLNLPPKEAAVFMRELGNYVEEGYFYGLVFHK